MYSFTNNTNDIMCLINFEELFRTNHKQIFFYGFEKNYTKSAVKLSGFFQIKNKTKTPWCFLTLMFEIRKTSFLWSTWELRTYGELNLCVLRMCL